MFKRSILLALALSSLMLGNSNAAQTSGAYQLELMGKPVRNGELVQFSVRLVRESDGVMVPDAVLEVNDFNMSPEGMSGNETVHPLPSNEPGVFNFEVRPVMGGRWALVVTARVPGEAEPVEDTLTVPVPE